MVRLDKRPYAGGQKPGGRDCILFIISTLRSSQFQKNAKLTVFLPFMYIFIFAVLYNELLRDELIYFW